MSLSFHTLLWNNSLSLYESHKKVMDYLNINVNYYNLDQVSHGLWMNDILKNINTNVMCFLDVDCVPTNIKIIQDSVNYVLKNDTFIGIAQASNHIKPVSHVYAGAAFFCITRSCYEKLGCPSFLENERSDVAEEVSYAAEECNVRYRALYPTHYEKPSTEGLWPLSNYGVFAIGTHYRGGIYHLFQGRFSNNIKLFEKRCKQIINNKFNLKNMIDCVDL